MGFIRKLYDINVDRKPGSFFHENGGKSFDDHGAFRIFTFFIDTKHVNIQRKLIFNKGIKPF